MKCNDIINRGKNDYRRDCAEENCPYNFTPNSCRYTYTGKDKVKEMLLKIKEIVDAQFDDFHENKTDYDTGLIITMNSIFKVVEKELKEID